MELTVTLLFKFTLGLQILLAIFFIVENKNTLQQKVNFSLYLNLFQKIQHYVSLLSPNPVSGFVLKKYCRIF